MQRRELKKAIKKFSHKTNFYKLGLVRQYLKKQEEEHIKLINAVPKIVCPHCGSKYIDIERSDEDFCDDSWLYCKDCGEEFDDNYNYIDAIENLRFEPWGDNIAIELHFGDKDIKSKEWQDFCEKEIKKYLGLIKEKSIYLF